MEPCESQETSAMCQRCNRMVCWGRGGEGAKRREEGERRDRENSVTCMMNTIIINIILFFLFSSLTVSS